MMLSAVGIPPLGIYFFSPPRGSFFRLEFVPLYLLRDSRSPSLLPPFELQILFISVAGLFCISARSLIVLGLPLPSFSAAQSACALDVIPFFYSSDLLVRKQVFLSGTSPPRIHSFFSSRADPSLVPFFLPSQVVCGHLPPLPLLLFSLV